MSSRSSVPVETTSFGYFKSNLETLNEVLVDCEKCEIKCLVISYY